MTREERKIDTNTICSEVNCIVSKLLDIENKMELLSVTKAGKLGCIIARLSAWESNSKIN